MATATHQFDLDSYLRRIGWTGEPRTDAATLRSVHRAHAMGIPFENIDPLLGSVPSLELTDLQAKMVHGRRGGYCYEHNTLLAAALKEIGFTVTILTGRVVAGASGKVLPRTHMLLSVDVPGEETPFVADVGFGIEGGLLEAVPLRPCAGFRQFGRELRLDLEPQAGPSDRWVLRSRRDGNWETQYFFTLEPFEPVDIAVLNWHIATNPRSPARRLMHVHITSPEAHTALTDRVLVEQRIEGAVSKRKLGGEEEVRAVLADVFGIELPEGLHLPV
ncbi:arylamine N-acetyltransferase [Kitasatospora sp. NBC_00085]|uniref:arylamine N-acetyltransferase family protein n=1 Tax=unclassified Kitasatospora TaxID=2633591 RepID=UPI0032557D51